MPDLRTVKQPETLTPDEFIDLVERIDNERLDPLICARNQGMLWMTYGSCFRAVEVSQWKIKEAIYPNGDLVHLTKLRAAATKGNYPAIAPIVIDEQRQYVNKWLDYRVKHRIKLGQNKAQYRGLDPESHVFLSFHRGIWQNFSLTRKISKGKEYFVATAVQNLISKLYKNYGFDNSSSHTGRHSMARLASKLLKQKSLNADPIVQNLLHHRSIESQKDYTDVDFKHIRECSRDMFPEPKKRGRKPKE
ncbi:tyrosine-type recombinase/integrase [uncultured Shewanella sp.]|uniref:tyrosine-type recombinase/integrase n=1 Tax=uncultured Shewanella sp. TaxID=173975 RepID=UPI0026263367|nr:tyrosine-type recombinase/integrase [uncultured Shewanella sp.]